MKVIGKVAINQNQIVYFLTLSEEGEFAFLLNFFAMASSNLIEIKKATNWNAFFILKLFLLQ